MEKVRHRDAVAVACGCGLRMRFAVALRSDPNRKLKFSMIHDFETWTYSLVLYFSVQFSKAFRNKITSRCTIFKLAVLGLRSLAVAVCGCFAVD